MSFRRLTAFDGRTFPLGAAALIACAVLAAAVLLVVSVRGSDEHCSAADLAAREDECGHYDASGAWLVYTWIIPGVGGRPPHGHHPVPPPGGHRKLPPTVKRAPGDVNRPVQRPAQPPVQRPVRQPAYRGW